MSLARTVLGRLGVLPWLRRLRRFLRRQRRATSARYAVVGTMLFPTFGAETNTALAAEVDYVRYGTIGLALQRILSEDIPGSLAEAGVYQGMMSRFIHQLAPDRRYYLFDTFEGFPRQDLEPGMSGIERFRDTTEALVLRNIGDSRNIVIRRGYVPDTLSGLENERFAFVLIDLDLYQPTLPSLMFFYPRLAPGGYLVVHDYNNPESNWGCKRALDEFMADKPEKAIEVADMMGTALFRKL